MSDWDILAPVDNQQGETQENESVETDGMFFADNNADNDSFGDEGHEENSSDFVQPMNEAQSFNPRMHNEHFKRKDFYRHRGDYDADKPTSPKRGGGSYYKHMMSHSYTERKIHDGPGDNFGSRRHRSRRSSMNRRNRRDSTSDSDIAMASVPHDLLEGGFDEAKYVEFHDAAKNARYTMGIGKAPEMNSLYYFWCYFLRDNFDQLMFDEFLETARQDAIGKSHYGIECFFRFCSYGLEKRWDEKVFEIFQQEALKDYKRGSKYGLEKVKGFLVHQKYDFPITPIPEMAAVLEQFPTLESFKDPATKKGKGKGKGKQTAKDDNYLPRSAPKNGLTPPQLRRNSKIEVSRPQRGKNAQPKLNVVKANGRNLRHKNDEPAANGSCTQPASAPGGESPMQQDI
ncbi:lupus la ribonucleoprotein [Tritrichomonas foetus]|uniref:Lupus la ribonucleoprotein n=1 Tax=Tritrichomonas foetus TaxID=1144522 RepID=A0A1J4JE02_9EUKA|nr:lupus la ribonucleoprotein [Tritrichomonas foetus]|eukprot:OHS95669.1 lupus la ribonucleoprotein [Tritrichomonas foetus]